MATNFTVDQQKAIDFTNKNLLVSAAAGSGKTAVLVERIIKIITNTQKPIDIDRLLVVTFTEAAAREMRQRILSAINVLLEETPDDVHLQRQIMLLPKASITTIHSFCLSVIRKYFYKIDIDPSFRIIDATEAELLKVGILSELFEGLYEEENNEDFLDLVEGFSDKIKDDKLQAIVLRLYNFSRSCPDPEKWLETAQNNLNVSTLAEFEKTNMYEFFKKEVFETLELSTQATGILLNLCEHDEVNPSALETIGADEDIISNIKSSFSEDMEATYNAFNASFSTLKLAGKGGEEVTEEALLVREQIKTIREDLIKAPIKKLQEKFFSQKPEEMLKNIKGSLAYIKALVKITNKFSKLFYDFKREKNIADFNDFEHLCIDVLVDKNEEMGGITPSFAAEELREFYAEILTDEYQDSNLVQELILSSISKTEENCKNRFIVGDIKQSIYKFRMANPEIFIGKYNSYFADEFYDEKEEIKINLSLNFRSRKNILDSINFIFMQVMSENLGDVKYDENAALYYGANYADTSDVNSLETEVIVIECKEEKEESEGGEDEVSDFLSDLTNAEIEAKVVAEKIKNLLEEPCFQVSQKDGTTRNIEPRDITILLRSPKAVSDVFVRELRNSDLPAFSDVSGGYFEATEVMVMLSLLKTIDNPRQDIELITVLYSNLFGVTVDELVYVRNVLKKGMFFDCVKQYILTGENEVLVGKLKNFLDKLNYFREISTQNPISSLVSVIYKDTDYENYVSLMPAGKTRKANLTALFERAVKFETGINNSLFHFIKYIENLQRNNAELGSAKIINESENLVKIMSIHKSKGLEFPVVFLCTMGKKFNLLDTRGDILYHQKYGFGAVNVDLENRIKFETFPKAAIASAIKKESISEELRVLYVALTRAKEKMFLVGCEKDLPAKMDKINYLLEGDVCEINSLLLQNCTSYLSFVTVALLRHKDAKDVLISEENQIINRVLFDHASKWKIEIINKKTILEKQEAKKVGGQNILKQLSELDLSTNYSGKKSNISEVLSYNYKDVISKNVPSKISISEIKRINYLSSLGESQQFEKIFQAENSVEFKKPNFLTNEKINSARLGTLIHAVMERLDLSIHVSTKEVNNLVTELVKRDIITLEESELIPIDKILNFVNGEIGKRIKKSVNVQKEIPFVIGVFPEEISEEFKGAKEKILIHGIIDCIFYEDDNIILVDYKSDKVNEKNIDNKLKTYKIQLDIYKKAIEQATNKKVKESLIYFFELDKCFNV